MALLLAVLAGCGDDTSVCTDVGNNPPHCEICNNERDDDLDGDVDCRDSECDNAVACRDNAIAVTSMAEPEAMEDEPSTTFPVR